MKARTINPSVISGYESWLRPVPWQLFCTFTFAYQVSELQANKVFDGFINRLERSVRSSVIYVRGMERRFSGCGMPGCPLHFHVVVACAVRIDPLPVKLLWESMAGTRSHGAGADIRAYDPSKEGISYVLKFLNENQGDWTFRNLELALKDATRDRRQRRRYRRNWARA